MIISSIGLAFVVAFSLQTKVDFTISNTSSEPIRLEIGSIRNMTLAPNSSTDVRLTEGEEIRAIVTQSGQKEPLKLLLLTVDPTLQGKTVKADKLLKKARKN